MRLRGVFPDPLLLLLLLFMLVILPLAWITGVAGGPTVPIEELVIYPDSAIVEAPDGGWMLRLHLVNRGDVAAVVYRVALDDYSLPLEDAKLVGGSGCSVDHAEATITVNVGGDCLVEIPVPSDLRVDISPGTIHTVKVYTANGNVFVAVVTVRG